MLKTPRQRLETYPFCNALLAGFFQSARGSRFFRLSCAGYNIRSSEICGPRKLILFEDYVGTADSKLEWLRSPLKWAATKFPLDALPRSICFHLASRWFSGRFVSGFEAIAFIVLVFCEQSFTYYVEGQAITLIE
jgi:hypothetical protein